MSGKFEGLRIIIVLLLCAVAEPLADLITGVPV